MVCLIGIGFVPNQGEKMDNKRRQNEQRAQIKRQIEQQRLDFERVSCYYLFITACNESNEECGAVISK
jgi:hypothetical protein